jgi:predicted amidophosphoribosyltransferase
MICQNCGKPVQHAGDALCHECLSLLLSRLHDESLRALVPRINDRLWADIREERALQERALQERAARERPN